MWMEHIRNVTRMRTKQDITWHMFIEVNMVPRVGAHLFIMSYHLSSKVEVKEVEIFWRNQATLLQSPHFMATSTKDEVTSWRVMNELSVWVNYYYRHKCTLYAPCFKWDDIQVKYKDNTLTQKKIHRWLSVISFPSTPSCWLGVHIDGV